MGCSNNNAEVDSQAQDRRDKIQGYRDKGKALVAAKQAHLDNLLKNRKPVVNPYAGMTNQMANLSVSTKAAEFQAEQTDRALANTLDAMVATGSGAGGATALAQAALQSKKGVSANIEKQEANNEKLKAQGEAQLQAVKLSEAQRVQGIQLSEAQRMQQADVSGQQYMFGATENRETSRLDRLSGLSTQASVDINAAQAGQAQVISGGINALGNIAGSYMQANATNSNQPTLNPDGSVKQ